MVFTLCTLWFRNLLSSWGTQQLPVISDSLPSEFHLVKQGLLISTEVPIRQYGSLWVVATSHRILWCANRYNRSRGGHCYICCTNTHDWRFSSHTSLCSKWAVTSVHWLRVQQWFHGPLNLLSFYFFLINWWREFSVRNQVPKTNSDKIFILVLDVSSVSIWVTTPW